MALGLLPLGTRALGLARPSSATASPQLGLTASGLAVTSATALPLWARPDGSLAAGPGSAGWTPVKLTASGFRAG